MLRDPGIFSGQSNDDRPRGELNHQIDKWEYSLQIDSPAANTRDQREIALGKKGPLVP